MLSLVKWGVKAGQKVLDYFRNFVDRHYEKGQIRALDGVSLNGRFHDAQLGKKDKLRGSGLDSGGFF